MSHINKYNTRQPVSEIDRQNIYIDHQLNIAQDMLNSGNVTGAFNVLQSLHKSEYINKSTLCRIYKDLAIASILYDPMQTYFMDQSFYSLGLNNCLKKNQNIYLKAIIKLWQREKDERTSNNKLKQDIKKTKALLKAQDDKITELNQKIKELEFQLNKIKQIHREMEQNRSLPSVLNGKSTN